MDQSITRREAQQQGAKWYYTGKPCKHGHISKRQTSNGACWECAAPRNRANGSKWYHERGGKARVQASCARWNKENAERKKAKNAEWRASNADRIRETNRAWAQANPERLKQAKMQWLKINHAHHRKYRAEWYQKRKTDPAFSIISRLRSRMGIALTKMGAVKASTTMRLVGCSPDQLMAHIQAQFLPGMSWENRNEWHIDHIRPCASFDMLDPEQQQACFHYTNLRPLWASDNLRKGAKPQ